MANVAELLILLKAETSSFTKGMGDARKLAFDSSDAIVSSLGKIGNSLGNLKFDGVKEAGKSLAMLGGIAAGVGVGVAGAMFAMAKSVSDTAEQMDKLSQSYGLTIEEVSSLRVASKLTAVDMDTLTSGMGKLAKAAAQVAEDGHTTGGAFKMIGVSVTDANGKLRPLSDLLPDVAEKFSRMENGTGKTALAMALFGKAGAALIPFLNRGKQGIREFQEEAKRLGLVMSKEDAAAALQFNDALDMQELKMLALKEQMARGLMPTLANLSDLFLTVDHNGNSLAKSIGEGVGSAFRGLAKSIAFATYELQFWIIKYDQITNSRAWKLMRGANNAAAEGMWGGGKGLGEAMGDVVAGLFGGKSKVDYNAQLEAAGKDFWKRMEEIDAPPKPLPQWKPPKPPKPGAGSPGGTPEGKGEDVKKTLSELESLLNKTRSLSNRAEGDPLATQIDNLKHLRRELENFASAHPDVIYWDINAAVNTVNASLAVLEERQRVALNTIFSGSLKAQADQIGTLPDAIPTVSGQVQAQAAILRLNDDPAERNRLALQLYNETATAVDRYAESLERLEILKSKGNITPEEYAEGKLRLDKTLKESTAQRGARAGITSGMENFGKEWEGIGVESMHSTQNALQGMNSALGDFFSTNSLRARSLGEAFSNLGAGMSASIINAAGQVLAKWTMTHTLMLLTHTSTNQAIVGSTAASAAERTAIESTTAHKSILKSAKSAAAKSWNALADIPLIGPALGAAAAAATFAGVLALGGFEEGGLVGSTWRRPGRSDTIPAMLAPGEGVLTRSAMASLGAARLNAFNRGDFSGLRGIQPISVMARMPEGLGTSRPGRGVDSAQQPAAGGHTFNVSVNGSSDPKKTADMAVTRMMRLLSSDGVKRNG